MKKKYLYFRQYILIHFCPGCLKYFLNSKRAFCPLLLRLFFNQSPIFNFFSATRVSATARTRPTTPPTPSSTSSTPTPPSTTSFSPPTPPSAAAMKSRRSPARAAWWRPPKEATPWTAGVGKTPRRTMMVRYCEGKCCLPIGKENVAVLSRKMLPIWKENVVLHIVKENVALL